MTAARAEHRDRSSIGGRYERGAALGEGGVAVVFRARDTVTGRDVALKQLREDLRGDRERAIELFRQEFHTLSQLAHPRVVSVYDYGVTGDAPYYTMELLDGGDLLDRVPWEWRTACSLARDVCSVLSLIHSRRMVYRDLSPKNVRCTSDGRAKLLDFGALSPMGPVKLFVGTPAIAAPEAVHLQPLDARTDLYSLGATLYFALTGRRPYPASKLAQLPDLWRTTPPVPSVLVPDVPPALDDLVMELLQLEPASRPASAAEALDRLTAIASLERDEGARLVSRSYLATPTLVGRDASLEVVRRRMNTAFGGAGGSVLIRGPRGVGRTRFLDACVLEAKIAGAVVLRADATDSVDGDLGVARALATQLSEAVPELGPAPGGDGADAQPALREWFLAVAAERPLLVAVDDIDRVDLPSTALVALLARSARDRKLLVATTIPADAAGQRSNALGLLEQESRLVSLSALNAAKVELLCRSMFGDVPNVQHVAHRLHALSGGFPRDLMHLAQHLLDTGLVAFASGVWVLPQQLDADDLPRDMTEARRAKIATLGVEARALAQSFALGPSGRFTFDECVLLSEHGDPGKVMSALDELVQAQVVSLLEKDYALSGVAWRDPLVQGASEAHEKASYAKLSAICAKRPGSAFLAARYLLDAGEDARGLDALVHFSVASSAETDASVEAFTRLLQALPDDWVSVFDRGLELCDKLGREPRDALILRSRAVGIISQLSIDAPHYFAALLEQLTKDAGLDIYDSLDPAVSPGERLNQSIARATARHSQCGSARVFPPAAAIPRVGQAVAAAVGSVAACFSIDLLMLLPSLSPFAPLSPAFSSWQTLIDAVRVRVLGNAQGARELYERQLQRLSEPDHGGLEGTYAATQELGLLQTLGMMEASMGLEKCVERAKAIEVSPMHEINALKIRALWGLFQGDVAESDRCKSQAELLGIERVRRQTNEGAHLIRELLGHALMDDLTRVKRTLDAIEPLARRAAGWKSVLDWANAEYQRIRGNRSTALVYADSALSSMHPAGHPVWADTAGARLRILVAENRFAEARDAGLVYLAEANRRGILYERSYIHMPLALACAALGHGVEAEAHADAAIAIFVELGTIGLNLGLAYETRARVAMRLGSRDDFEKFMSLTAEHYRTSQRGPLAARHERLARDARATFGEGKIPSGTALTGEFAPIESVSRIRARLNETSSPGERAEATLALLLENSGASEGFLVGMSDGQLVVKARIGVSALSDETIAAAKTHLLDQCRSEDLTIVTADVVSEVVSQWTVDTSHTYQPVVLSHEVDGALAITGLAVLLADRGDTFRHPASTAAHLSSLTDPDEFVGKISH
jgi:hypothetical protein